MIIVVTDICTHFVNEKNFDIVSHHIEHASVQCMRGDYKVEYFNVKGVAFITDANANTFESGFPYEEGEITVNRKP